MKREDLDALGRQLYRDPELFVPLRDALEEQGIAWGQWLEQSGTLERLSECLVLARGGHRDMQARMDRHYSWRKAIGHAERVAGEPHEYVALCEAFRAPPLMIEVGSANWRPPSPEFAHEILRRYVRAGLPAARKTLGPRWKPTTILPDLVATCHRLEPDILAMRLRLGENGRWTREGIPRRDPV